jgi:hypothetical protein
MDSFHDIHPTTSARIELSAASSPALRPVPVAMSLSHWGNAHVDRTRGDLNAGGMKALVTRCPRP